MKNIRKKLLPALLAAAMMTSLMPCAGYAQSDAAPAPQVTEDEADTVIDIPYSFISIDG